jgi:hypothetical protein
MLRSLTAPPASAEEKTGRSERVEPPIPPLLHLLAADVNLTVLWSDPRPLDKAGAAV